MNEILANGTLEITYVIASVLFIFGLKMLSHSAFAALMSS